MLVSYRLDYCNSLFADMLACHIQRLQSVQNALAASPCKFQDHTIRIQGSQWTGFVVFIRHTSSHVVDESSDLAIPHMKNTSNGGRSFIIAGPTLWNTIASELRQSSLVSNFHNRLKIFLFTVAYKTTVLTN